MIKDTKARLERLVRKHDLSNPKWLRDLDEFDDPPLFYRNREVEFLRKVPSSERLPLLIEVTLAEFDRIAKTLDALDRPERFFACVTLTDFDQVREGIVPVPTPRILVSPDWQKESLTSHWSCLSSWSCPLSAWARLVQDWTREVGRADVCVGEHLPLSEEDEDTLVYIGYRRGAHQFLSLGDLSRE